MKIFKVNTLKQKITRNQQKITNKTKQNKQTIQTSRNAKIKQKKQTSTIYVDVLQSFTSTYSYFEFCLLTFLWSMKTKHDTFKTIKSCTSAPLHPKKINTTTKQNYNNYS